MRTCLQQGRFDGQSRSKGQRLRSFICKENHEDLLVLKELIEASKLTPFVGKTFPLSAVADAIRYIREHACDPCTVKEAMRAIPVSRRTLERQFAERLGALVASLALPAGEP